MPPTHHQKHQNKTGFKPGRGIKLKNCERDAMKRSVEQAKEGVCDSCRAIIDWKVQYGKFKQINNPKKCSSCGARNIPSGYHMICSKCSDADQLCRKCCKTRIQQGTSLREMEKKEPMANEIEIGYPGWLQQHMSQKKIEAVLASGDVRERERRSLLRRLNGGKSYRNCPDNNAEGHFYDFDDEQESICEDSDTSDVTDACELQLASENEEDAEEDVHDKDIESRSQNSQPQNLNVDSASIGTLDTIDGVSEDRYFDILGFSPSDRAEFDEITRALENL